MILKHGYEFDESRVICNAHYWYTAVKMGRVMWNEAVKRLCDNEVFQRDLEVVEEEVLEIVWRSRKRKND